MQIDTLRSSELLESRRLDSGYHLSAGRHAAATLANARERGVTFRPLGQPEGIGTIWQPDRFKRAYAARGEEKLAYLRPYDVFEYLPMAADYLSATRNRNAETYKLRRGMILQSCSGRNLGPAVIVDAFLEKYVIGDDMLRIEVPDENLRLYVLAYLKTSLAQALLRQGKTGSVIDHISVEHVAALQIPILAKPYYESVVQIMREAVNLKERARRILDEIQSRYENELPKLKEKAKMSVGWTVKSKKLTSRLDAASYDPLVFSIRTSLQRLGGKRVEEVADVLKPAGRYKTTYVGAMHGTPILSGTQLLQHTPINLQYIADRALKNKADYEVKAGWLAYQADGRAEETLGLPVMITPDREGWLASGHVGRVVAKPGIDRGWLCAALRTPQCQVQIKALASGSVVDSTFPNDMESVVLPPRVQSIRWSRVTEAWFDFAKVTELEHKAIRILERKLLRSDLHLN